MQKNHVSSWYQIESNFRELYTRIIWRLYIQGEDYTHCPEADSESAILKDIYDKIAAEVARIDKIRPAYVPHKFYKTVVWNIHTSSEHLRTLDTKIEQNKIIQRGVTDKISYLTNLVSHDDRLESFYSENGQESDLLIEILSLFCRAPEWAVSHKTSGHQDASVAKRLQVNLNKSYNVLLESADIRWNLQMQWQQYLQDILGDVYKPMHTVERISEDGSKAHVFPHAVDFGSALHAMAQHLEGITASVGKKKSAVKKIHAGDAVVHYVARGLKELFEKYRVNKRQHVKYITDIINVVMKENTSDERIRKLVA